MAIKTETLHALDFLVSEAAGGYSRETVTIVSGQNLKAGRVLGRITASGKFAAYDDALATGVEVARAILADDVDATGGDVKAAVIARNAQVNAAELDWGGQLATPIANGTADLLPYAVVGGQLFGGIILR